MNDVQATVGTRQSEEKPLVARGCQRGIEAAGARRCGPVARERGRAQAVGAAPEKVGSAAELADRPQQQGGQLLGVPAG
jgi:hypothetical protein